MTDELDLEALERLRAEATPGEWRYRPLPRYDDWGVIREEHADGTFGHVIARACGPFASDEDKARHRVKGTDPYGHNGRLIVAAVNALPSLIAAARERDALLAERAQLRAALERNKRLHDEALPKFNWGASALDANAIGLLNEVPRETIAALKDTP